MPNTQQNIAKNRAARLSVISNSFLVALKLTAGIIMGSVSVISEAIHSGIDLLASLIAWFAVRESGKPADEQHHYGHGKIESVSGTIEGVLIFAAAILIIIEAGEKLMSGATEVQKLGMGAGVMAISATVNFFVSRHLYKVAKQTDSAALEADALHLRTDVYTTAGVTLGLVAIKLTGIAQLDSLVAILVALMIIKEACSMTMGAFAHVLDVKLPAHEEAVIHEVMNEHQTSVVEYHKVRSRKSGHQRYIDMHLVVPKATRVDDAHNLSHVISGQIEHRLPHSHVLIHIEPCESVCNTCDGGKLLCHSAI